MKKILGLLLMVTLGMSAQAADWLPTRPIRQAKIKGSIMKNFVKRENGTIEVTSEFVCHFDSLVDVFDNREKQDWVSFTEVASCPSTIEGRPVAVLASGAMDHVSDSPGKSLKTAQLSLETRNVDDGVYGTKPLMGFVGTRDLSSTSLYVHILHIFAGDPSLPAKEEMFSVKAEFIDDHQ